MLDDRRQQGPGRRGIGLALGVTRVAVPAAMVLVGIAAVIAGHARTPLAGAGVVLIGAALIVWMINWLFRMSLESNRDREREEEAREYFDEHGRWPGE
jgi:threonine/homoserine/homoserine lactone efflux protein